MTDAKFALVMPGCPAMTVQAAQDAGLASALHVEGGLDAWKKAQGPLAR